jgi:hypothetical protein
MDYFSIIFYALLGAAAIFIWHRLTRTYTDFRNRAIVHRNDWNFNGVYSDDIRAMLRQRYLFFSNLRNVMQLNFIEGVFQSRRFKLFEIVHSFGTNLLAVEIENLDKARTMEIVSKNLPYVLLEHFRTNLIKGELDYAVFNKEFDFFKTKREDQYYMLSPDMMEALLDLRTKIGPFGLEANKNNLFVFCAYPPYLEYLKKPKNSYDQNGLEKEKIYKEFMAEIIKVDNKI